MLLALEPGANARKADGLVLVLLLSVLFVDFAFPLRSVLSPVLLALASVLVLPWARGVLQGGGPAAAMSRSIEAWSFRIAVVALAAIVLVAKWWLLGVSDLAEPDQFIGSSR